MKKELIQTLTDTFEGHAQQTETGVEYWLARDIQHLLGYAEWRNFGLVISKAKTACEVSGQRVTDHFVDVNKMVCDPLTTHFAGGLGLADHESKVTPFRVAQEVLNVSR